MGKQLWDLAKSRFEIATILLGHRYIVSPSPARHQAIKDEDTTQDAPLVRPA